MNCPDNRFCCHECEKIKSKIDEGNKQVDQQFVCITFHPGFRSVCLDPWVLDAYRQDWGRIQKPQQSVSIKNSSAHKKS